MCHCELLSSAAISTFSSPDITEFAAGTHSVPLQSYRTPSARPTPSLRAQRDNLVFFSPPTLQNLRIENRLLTLYKIYQGRGGIDRFLALT